MGIAGARLRIGLAVASLALGTLGAVALPGGVSTSSAATSPWCGPTITKADGTAWVCKFSDDFGGWKLDETKWTPLTTARTGVVSQECRVDDPRNIGVRMGRLRLTVRRLSSPMLCRAGALSYHTQYTGGAVSTGQKFSQRYGRWEIRAAFPDAKVKGLHSALWMWPQDTKYPKDVAGEIDIAEYRTHAPDRVVPTLHYLSDVDLWESNWNCSIERPERFHTYALEWSPTTMTFVYDGQVCWSHAWHPASPFVAPAPFDEPYFLNMNQSLGTGPHNQFDPATTPLPASMYIDYVRVWK